MIQQSKLNRPDYHKDMIREVDELLLLQKRGELG